MSIPEGYRTNFETLNTAFANGDAALVECTHRETGEVVIVICAVFMDDEGMVNVVPFAKMFDGNPYDEVDPPEGGLGEDDAG